MKGPRIYNSLSPEEQELRLQEKQKRREKKIHRSRRNRIIAVFTVLVLILGVQISLKNVQTRKINNQVQASKQTLTKVTHKQKDLKKQKTNLKDPDYVAKIIRSKFLYSKPNEIIYNIPGEKDNN